MQIKRNERLVLLVLLVLLTLASCAVPRYGPPTEDMGIGITRYVDHEAQVVCWYALTAQGVGLSCLPIRETALEFTEVVP